MKQEKPGRRSHEPKEETWGITPMEHIGHITAPLDERSRASLQKMMQVRGGSLHKANRNPADNWWVLILPEGTMQEMQTPHVGVPRYTIILPDGTSFHFEAGSKNQYGLFIRDPSISLNQPEEEGK